VCLHTVVRRLRAHPRSNCNGRQPYRASLARLSMGAP
jgi:hypothetical protein